MGCVYSLHTVQFSRINLHFVCYICLPLFQQLDYCTKLCFVCQALFLLFLESFLCLFRSNFRCQRILVYHFYHNLSRTFSVYFQILLSFFKLIIKLCRVALCDFRASHLLATCLIIHAFWELSTLFFIYFQKLLNSDNSLLFH